LIEVEVWAAEKGIDAGLLGLRNGEEKHG